MRVLKSTMLFLFVLTLSTMNSCVKDNGPIVNQKELSENVSDRSSEGEEKARLHPRKTTIKLTKRTPVQYLGNLGDNQIQAVHGMPLSYREFNYYDFGDYYQFYGYAGDEISVEVRRVSGDMDPRAQIVFGLINEGIEFVDLVRVAEGDDEIPSETCYGDPFIEAVLPYDGYYTLGVWDYFSCGDDLSYVINTIGIDDDQDDDGVLDFEDNCPFIANSGQEDADNDGIGDVCDDDSDNDGVPNAEDNCPFVANPDQEDFDNDGIGDLCDDDNDNDGVTDEEDNCPFVANPDQEDFDNDGLGDVCDDDDDNDGCLDVDDAYPFSSLSTTIIIEGCDTQVPNLFTDICGQKLSDVIEECIANGGNKGQVKKCVNAATREWKKAGLINQQERASILQCLN